MSDVVGSDELLRRIQRARAWAQEEEERWKTHAGDQTVRDSNEALGSVIRACAYEAVRKVLDEVIEPGTNHFD